MMTRSGPDTSADAPETDQTGGDPRPFIWVTRPRPQAEAHAKALAALGLRPLLSPVLTIRKLPLPDAPPLASEDIRGLIFTSLNGILHFPKHWIAAFARHPVFVSGTATLDAAKEAGFADVHGSAGRGSRGMPSLVRTVIPAVKGAPAPAVLYVAGSTRTPWLEDALAPDYDLTLLETYQSALADRLSPLARQAFQNNQVIAATLFSSRSGANAAKLLRDSFGAGADELLRSLLAVCISKTVADRVRQSGFTRIAVSDTESAESVTKKLVEQLKNDVKPANLF